MYNAGQTAVFVKDLKGTEYPAIATVNRKRRVNGQREITLSFLYTEINKDFMKDLEFGWKVLFKGDWYTITHPGYETDGDHMSVSVTAVLSFFVVMNGFYHQDKASNKSMTPSAYFEEVFSGTMYNYSIISPLAANTLNYEDNQSKTARFLYGIDRYKSEFEVAGNMVYIKDMIGYDKDVILHEDLNVKRIRIEVNASGFHTWAKGYGDLPEDDPEGDYQIEVEYRSPLIGKYGAIEGPAYKNGNFKHKDNLIEAVKNQVDNSYSISTEIDAVDLTQNGYPEMVFNEGDRIWLYVNRLDLNQQVRVMEVDETFDWEGNIIDVRYTLGNEGIASRYKTQQYDTLKDFQDIVTGRNPIKYDWLPGAVKRASEIINGNKDSLFQYHAGEIIGINQSDPNGYMRFNTDGLGFSRDGGKTYQSAITYEGINANAITTGLLSANRIRTWELVVGDNIAMGPNAIISWGQVYDRPSAEQLGAMPIKTYIDETGVFTGMVRANRLIGDTFLVGNGVTTTKLELYTRDNGAHYIRSDQAAGFRIESTGSLSFKASDINGILFETIAKFRSGVVIDRAGYDLQVDAGAVFNYYSRFYGLVEIHYGGFNVYGTSYFGQTVTMSSGLNVYGSIGSLGSISADESLNTGSGTFGYIRHRSNQSTYMRLGSDGLTFYVAGTYKQRISSIPKNRLDTEVDESGKYITSEKSFIASSVASLQPVLQDLIQIDVSGRAKVYLNDNFKNFTGWYEVFARGGEVIEIYEDHFVIEADGTVTCLIVGVENRKEGIRGYDIGYEVLDVCGCEEEPVGWQQSKEQTEIPIFEQPRIEKIKI
ncbi:phage tail protein [Metabacillus lacus]|nr:phage tail protein [Metabacillus lacus]